MYALWAVKRARRRGLYPALLRRRAPLTARRHAQDIVAHPNYDEFWQSRSLRPQLRDVGCAVLVTGGWCDAGDARTMQSSAPPSP